VARIAAQQKTLVTTEQLARCGLGKDAVAYRVASGRLREVFQSVYSLSPGELPALALELGALFACGKGSLISHRSAAFVWGMHKAPPEKVEVSVVRRSCWRRDGVVVHRIKAIDRRDLRRHEDLWVSSPARAVLEVAAVGTRDELIEVIDQGLALRRFTPGDLKGVLNRHRGRRGAARLSDLMGDETAMAISRSKAEKALLRLIRDARLPRPETNVKFGRFEADFVWHEQKLIVELDSPTFHGAPGAFQRDREKDLVFRDDGLRFTRADIIHEPAVVLVRLVRALARSDAEPSSCARGGRSHKR
jgi:very-short-patch-repair endonuclease